MFKVIVQNRSDSRSRGTGFGGYLVWVIPSRGTISFRRLRRACWTCHSLATAAGSPMVLARSSGVLAIIGLILLIADPPVFARLSRSDPNVDHLSGQNDFGRPQQLGKQRAIRVDFIVTNANHDDAKRQHLQILLIFQVPVKSNKGVE